jgi:hypothetical protein
MKGTRRLDYQETMFCWSPKLKKRIRLVGVQIALAEVAESRPTIQDFTFPGPEITLDVDPPTKHSVRMSARWRDGVTGAIDYLSTSQVKDGVRDQVLLAATRIGLRIEIIDPDDLLKQEKHLSSWRQLARYLHPMLEPSDWGVTEKLQKDDWPRERMSISDLSSKAGVEPQTALVAAAYLIHRGTVSFDSERGSYDLLSKVWRS